MERPSLNVVEGADKGKVFQLDAKPSHTLGRGHKADIPVMDIKCSREHCRVELRDDGWYLVDLGSSNGTRLNGKKLKKRSFSRLQPGDRVKLGYTVLTFVPGSTAGAAPIATASPFDTAPAPSPFDASHSPAPAPSPFDTVASPASPFGAAPTSPAPTPSNM